MGEAFPGAPPSARPPDDRLDSWKEIAAYLNRDVTTAQRWEKREGMPVHRHLHDRMGSVYASRAELDEWSRSRNLRAAQENVNEVSSPNPPAPPRSAVTFLTQWKFFLPFAAAGVALVIGASLWFREDGILLAKPDLGCAIPDGHGLRWNGAGRRDFARRSFRGVPRGPGRADGCMGNIKWGRDSSIT